MSDISRPYNALVARILDGDGEATNGQRRAAFDNTGLAEPLRTLLDKIAHHAYRVTGGDIAAVRASGLTEDQIFELVVCAAVGQATRQYQSGLAALETVTGSAHAPHRPR